MQVDYKLIVQNLLSRISDLELENATLKAVVNQQESSETKEKQNEKDAE